MKHYLGLFSSTYLAAWDLEGGDIEVTIAGVESVKLKNKQNKEETKGLLRFAEAGIKPMVLNKTNGAVIAQMYGPDPEGWVGLPVVLYATTCEVGGEVKPCIRVRLVVARPAAALSPVAMPVQRTAPTPAPVERVTQPTPRTAQPAAAERAANPSSNGSKKSRVA